MNISFAGQQLIKKRRYFSVSKPFCLIYYLLPIKTKLFCLPGRSIANLYSGPNVAIVSFTVLVTWKNNITFPFFTVILYYCGKQTATNVPTTNIYHSNPYQSTPIPNDVFVSYFYLHRLQAKGRLSSTRRVLLGSFICWCNKL